MAAGWGGDSGGGLGGGESAGPASQKSKEKTWWCRTQELRDQPGKKSKENRIDLVVSQVVSLEASAQEAYCGFNSTQN